jgi:protein-L-isoaspartate(D-aspartate) O-methyltransferase
VRTSPDARDTDLRDSSRADQSSTVQAGDISPVWCWGGRLVVPLWLRGISRSIAFDREAGDRLVSRSLEVCGFVRMQGAGASTLHTVQLHGDDVKIVIDDGQSIDEEAVRASSAPSDTRSSPEYPLSGNEGVLPHMDLWLASAMPTYGRFYASKAATARGVAGPAVGIGMSAVWDDQGTLAYTTWRPMQNEDAGFEVGILAHGPNRESLALQLADQVRVWNRDRRGRPDPLIISSPTATPDGQLPKGLVLNRKHTRLAITWD